MGIGPKISEFLVKIFTRRKLLEYGLPLLVLACGFAAYLLISGNNRRPDVPKSRLSDRSGTSGQLDLRDKTFINALYHYRLENFDRAGILFSRVLESSHSRKKKSTALLFLGNISFKNGQSGFESDGLSGFETALSFYEDALSLDKKNSALLHNISLALMELGRDDEAMSYARQLYAMRNKSPRDLLLFGNLLFMYGRYTEAAAVFSEGGRQFAGFTALFSYNQALSLLYSGDASRSAGLFTELFQNEKGSPYLAGLGAYQLGYLLADTEIEKAQEVLSGAHRIFSSNDGLAFDLALLLLKQERYHEAVPLLETAQNGMDEGSGRELLGYALFKSGRFGDALDLFASTAGRTGSETHGECYILGDLYMKRGEPGTARRYYERALTDGGYSGTLINLVRLLQETGEFQEAKEFCERYSRESPEDPIPGFLLADVLFYLGDRKEAVRQLEQAEALSNGDVEVLGEIAEVYRRHGYHNNALLIYHRALDSSPYDTTHLLRIASLYLSTGHKDRAKSLLDRARVHMEDLPGYYDVTLLSAACSGAVRAEELYRELILDFPYRYESYYNLSLLLAGAGRYEDSAETVNACLKDAVGMEPAAGSKLYEVLGYVHAEQEEWDEARRHYANARRSDPMNETALLNLRILDYRGQ